MIERLVFDADNFGRTFDEGYSLRLELKEEGGGLTCSRIFVEQLRDDDPQAIADLAERVVACWNAFIAYPADRIPHVDLDAIAHWVSAIADTLDINKANPPEFYAARLREILDMIKGTPGAGVKQGPEFPIIRFWTDKRRIAAANLISRMIMVSVASPEFITLRFALVELAHTAHMLTSAPDHVLEANEPGLGNIFNQTQWKQLEDIGNEKVDPAN